jgi:methylated-DNA-[protein]-cysteine S-methyltransferase
VDGGAVTGVSFGAESPPSGHDHRDPLVGQVLGELAGYFAGQRTAFTVPTRFTSGSPFDRAVWECIASIPYGQTRTYGEIAKAVGEAGAAQAVGAACGRNPVPVIVPCHRVVGAGGRLVGFGGGLPRKRHLLTLEARTAIELSLMS